MSRCFDGTESLPVITLLWNWIPKKTEPKCRFKPIPRHSACGADASQSPRHLIWSCFQRDCYSLSVGANRYLRIQAWIDANLRLYGVTCGQVLTYYCNFPRDRLSLKLLVGLLEAWSSITRIQPFSDSGCFCVGGVQCLSHDSLIVDISSTDQLDTLQQCLNTYTVWFYQIVGKAKGGPVFVLFANW